MAKNVFEEWFDTFLEEKNLPEKLFEIEHDGTTHFIGSQTVIGLIRKAPPKEQAGIKSMIVRIDFVNGNINDYFKHLAKGYIALNY